MATLTKKDLLEAIEGLLTKIKRYFCPCNDTYLSDRFIVNGQEYYELTCLRCGKKKKQTNMLTEQEYKNFISLVKKMRDAQKDVIYKSMFFALDSARPTAYDVAKTKQIVLEQEVDEYLKKMEV
jgi:hypothetical protein